MINLSNTNMKRRTFLKNAAAFSAGSLIVNPLEARYLSPNDKILIAVIGCNGMGWANVRSLLKNKEVDLVAIADVDQNAIQRRLVDYQKMRNNQPKTYSDYREMLNDPQIDVVVIGSPDHWHCKMFVDAVEAGKHVYVEKPIANTIEECNIMVKAASKSNVMVQVGQWQRSGPHYRQAIDIVQSGILGNIRLVKVWAYQGWMNPMKQLPDALPPEGVDYSFWLGPAPRRPFNPNRFHFNFRWFWDYAGGLMTDWGVHEIDIALYAMKAIAPISVMASGGKLAYPNDPAETPDTLQAVFQYPNFNMLWEHATGIDLGPYQRREGIAFIGNNGTLVLNRKGFEVLVENQALGYSEWGDPKMETIEKVDRPADVNYLDLHTQNFLEAIRTNDNKLLHTPIDSGSLAAINAQMGNIAYKTGNKLFWNQQKGQFDKNKKANKLVKAKYHNGWKVPKV